MSIVTLLTSLSRSIEMAFATLSAVGIGMFSALGARRRKRRAAPRVDDPHLAAPAFLAKRHSAPAGATLSESGVMELIATIAELPRTTWLAIGSAALTKDDAARRSAAYTALERAIDASGMHVAACYVRDTAKTASQVARCADDHLVSQLIGGRTQEQRVLDAARRAIELASLAVLARARLHPDDFDALYAPVAGCVPVGARHAA